MQYTPNGAENFEELDSECEANDQELPATIVIDKYDMEMEQSAPHSKTCTTDAFLQNRWKCRVTHCTCQGTWQ